MAEAATLLTLYVQHAVAIGTEESKKTKYIFFFIFTTEESNAHKGPKKKVRSQNWRR